MDQYVIAAHGKAEREWPFIACSESNFTDVSHVFLQAAISAVSDAE